MNEKPIADEKIKAFREKVEQDIARMGRSIIGTAGDFTDADGNTSEMAFAYTVGHGEEGLPDLIVTGMNGADAAYVLNSIGDKIIADARKATEDGEIYELPDITFINGATRALPVKPIAAGDAGKTHAYQAQYHEERAGRQASFVQLLWADAEGKLPGDEGYDEKRFPQPIIKR